MKYQMVYAITMPAKTKHSGMYFTMPYGMCWTPHGFPTLQAGNLEIKGFSATAMLHIAFINIFYCFVINFVSPHSTQPAEDGSAVDTTVQCCQQAYFIAQMTAMVTCKKKIDAGESLGFCFSLLF